jgi:hypothetical protein
MTDPRSPILDFYPEKFDVDMEGKRAEWEGVVKVPFVSESRLLEAVASIPLDRWVSGLGRGGGLICSNRSGRAIAEQPPSLVSR